MKRTAGALILCLIVSGTAQAQEVFDLLRKGDVAAVKALVEKSPHVLEARDGESHAYWVSAKILDVLKAKALERP